MRADARPRSIAVMERSPARAWGAVAASTTLLAAVLLVACDNGSSHPASTRQTAATPSTTSVPAPLPDKAPVAADFVNINTMTRVGDHFVGSLNGHVAEALAVARSATGGVYPVGTVIQFIPLEAMVKRHKGYSPATRDWEFFSLAVSARGTRIVQRGTANLKNPAGNCAACHSAAPPRFDFVCTKSHGCGTLTLPDGVAASMQQRDPRPKK